MEQLKREKRELVYQGSVVDVYKDYMLLPNGNRQEWDFVKHKMGAAAVLPVLEDGRILLVRQYRNALERYTLEIPAGGRESLTEPMEECAMRELQEETGCSCKELKPLLQLRTTVAFCDEFIHIFVATGLKIGEQKLDEAEFIELEAYTLEELKKKILSGEMQDSKTISAILAYAIQEA